MKEYKCKKCGLTYNTKGNPKCPYCGKKRPPKGIIFAIIIVVVALVSYYIITNSGIINSRTQYVDGLKIEIKDITIEKNDITKDKLKVILDITNTNIDKNSQFISFKTYIDDYEEKSESIIISELLSGKKTNDEITIYLENEDWKKIEIYYTTDYENYNLFYTITPNDIKQTQ